VVVLLAWTGPVEGQLPVQAGATATQAILVYQAPDDSTPCQVQVSRAPSLQRLVPDVNPTLFAGADLDTRPGSSGTGSTSRFYVVGLRRADLAADGKRHSRALEAATQYYAQVTCGTVTSGPAVTFTTLNPSLGNNFPEPPPFDPKGFGNYAWPTIDWQDQSKVYVDPMTGIALKRVTSPGWYGVLQTEKSFAFAIDLNNAWQNAGNIVSGKVSAAATYPGTGAGNDPIFVGFDAANVTGPNGSFGGWYPNQTLDNIMVRIAGSGSGTISGCLSDDSGASCLSPAVDMVTLGASGSGAGGTYPPACANDQSKGCFPNNGFWGGWNFPPIQWQMGATGGTVNVAATAVTAANALFNLNWKPGGKIYIAGSACPSNLCTIVSVNSSNSMTIQENAGTLTGAAFKSATAGVRLWVKPGSNKGDVSISVTFDYAYSDVFTMPANGSYAQCSPNPTTVTYAADGVTPIAPVAGQLCLANHLSNSTQVLYLLIPSTGETRLLAPIWVMNASDAAKDQVADPVAGNTRIPWAAFDATDANTIYAQVNTNGGTTLFKGVYDSATYRYKAYFHSLYPPVGTGYVTGQDTTAYWYRGPAWADTGITWTNMTKGSENMDLGSQIATKDPLFDGTLFRGPALTHVSKGRAFTINYPISSSAPESIALIHSFDLSTGKLAQSGDTWRTAPSRWCAIHSNFVVEGWFGLICNPLGGAFNFAGGAGVLGIGPWQTTPTAMRKNGQFTQDTSMTTSSPLEACPSIPASLQPLVPANPQCVTFQSRMACSQTPFAGENKKWPCEYNPNYSELQPLAPGDQLMVQNNSGEMLVILTVAPLGEGNYQFTAARGVTTNVGGLRNAPTGWTAYAVPPTSQCNYGGAGQGCTPGVGMWFDGSQSTIAWQLDPNAFEGHSDLGNGPTPGANTYCLPGACRYDVPFAQQIGSFATANVFGGASFGGVPGAIALQAYPSVHQLTAPPNERTWMLNFNHINPSYGAGPEAPATVGGEAYSLVPGTRGVYKFTAVNGGLNYKVVPPIGYAGYHLLQDVSSPLTGNIITDASPWQFCVVLNAGECQNGSAPGEAYASVPQTSVRTDQNCISNWYDDNFPCIFTPPPSAAWTVQGDISRSDPNGVNWRRITMGFSGPGRQFEFGTFIPDPTGTWGFVQGYWLDGARNDLLIAKLPPWPGLGDTAERGNFVAAAITVPADAARPKARIHFGYAENGPADKFYCTGRREACSSGGTPFAFEGERPKWESCAKGCTIEVPTVASRVLYYAIDRQDAQGKVTSGRLQVTIPRKAAHRRAELSTISEAIRMPALRSTAGQK
jgi:hypothetical protein